MLCLPHNYKSIRLSFLLALALVLASTILSSAIALDKIHFATNWRAQAEHGGFYQAVVDGTYARYGLDVTILQGGPQQNAELLLAAGRVEFAMGSNLFQMFESVRQKTPIIKVASIFQIDPVVLISHPNAGLDRFVDLPKATAYIASDFRVSAWLWLKQAHGFQDQNIKPYGFNSAPFLADSHAIQQGFLTSEPFAIEQRGGFKPNVFLLADYGYDTYSTTIDTRADLIANKPELVQRFVDASIIGWYHYLYGDSSLAHAAIKRDNPEMTDAQLDYSLAKMREKGVVDSGDALIQGIGVMTDARMQSFYEKMTQAQAVPVGLDYKKGYSLAFIGKKLGLELRTRP